MRGGLPSGDSPLSRLGPRAEPGRDIPCPICEIRVSDQILLNWHYMVSAECRQEATEQGIL